MESFWKQKHNLCFIVAILSLITYFIRQNSNNTIWLVLFFAWLSFGFTAMARNKDKEKNKNSNK
ncbi:hypothetical protein FQS96_15795 [Enterococcus faecalis]|uniref:hypothetical protein n=1 Tax=Enterococcus TaxID=1350 RepID=UPI001928E050|nr:MULTISPECIES: hypothetical protein [Enterococcus]MBO1126901.1 hypothetical protein [Enterococcus faecalis]